MANPTAQNAEKKMPLPTPVVPNPMHNYASWTYSWSLWWMDVGDCNNLMNQDDVNSAQEFKLSDKSYVVAEDGGRDPANRLPSQYGLNYQLQEVTLNTIIGLNKVSKHSNLLTGSMTILEPYGVTFIDTLADASWDPIQKQYVNYTQQPYMLQLDFKGYDDNGVPVPESEVALYRKRYPIVLLNMKVGVTGKGAEYKITFAPQGHAGLRNEHATTPADFTVTAGTVDEFFNGKEGLVNKYTDYWAAEVGSARYKYADSMAFDIDPTIKISAIANKNDAPITLASYKNPDSKTVATDLVLDKLTWTIPKGTPIVDLIAKVIVQSDWLIKQLGLDGKQSSDSNNQTDPTNLFKTTVKTLYQGISRDSGANGTPGVVVNAFDAIKQRRAMSFTFCINQYTTYKGSSASMNTMPDYRPWVIKNYNYLYTGKNTDIVDLKIDFDTTYYTTINSYNRLVASKQSSAATGDQTKLSEGVAFPLTPGSLGMAITPLQAVKTSTPMRVVHINGDINAASGLNGNRPDAAVAMDVLKSTYSGPNGDMLNVKLTIVGDPILLKQDDWLYTPSPTKSTVYNAQTSQLDFVNKYGHLRMDNAELIVYLTINTPIDIDTDYYNNGLVFPPANTMTSLFSGAYTILKIESKFVSGKFEQTLNLARYLNADYIEFFATSQATRGDNVALVRKNALAETSTNTSGAVVGGIPAPVTRP